MSLATETRPMTRREWLLSDRPQSRTQARLGRAYMTWRRFSANRLAVLGLCILLALVFVAIFADALAPHSPVIGNLGRVRGFCRPAAKATCSARTTRAARFSSRLIHGSRLTLPRRPSRRSHRAPVGLIRRRPSPRMPADGSTVLMRITDIFLAFPKLVLALAFVAALGPGIENAVIAIASLLAAYARIARAETLTVANSDYIAAVRLMGASPLRHRLPHVMPMCMSSLIVRVTLDMAGIILTAAGLGFLGLGAQPPLPEWGAMIASGRRFILDQWWVATMPGIAILIVSLGFNLLGDGLRDALDPRESGQ